MTQKQKLVRVSSRFLGPYRHFLFGLYILVFSSITILLLRESLLFGISQIIVYGSFLYYLIKMTIKLQQVSFDDDFLYVFRKQQDFVIPLENIKSIEIESIGGVYKVNLFYAEQLGDHFYFKTSLIYPLNFKSKDKLVDVLRSKIESAKRKKQTYQKNALMS